MLGGVSLIATLPALWALDKIGRRKMLFQVSPLLTLSHVCCLRSPCPDPLASYQGAILEAICAIIAGLVGHFLLPKPGTPKDLYTSSNKTGGAVLVAFAVLQIMCFSFFCESSSPPRALSPFPRTDPAFLQRGPHSLGLPRRVLPAPRPGQVHCPRHGDQLVLELPVRTRLAALLPRSNSS